MSVIFRKPVERRISDDILRGWRGIPTSVIADELNRSGGMSSRIQSISQTERFVGEALPVQVMVGDNLALHIAIHHALPHMAIAVDAGGCMRTAVWGEILHAAAEKHEVAGVVVDGVVRDRAVLRESRLPIFAKGSTPNGPHKGWGGEINGHIQCGGVAVCPNDVIIGDADGVVVVPKLFAETLLAKCKQRIKFESNTLAALREGRSTLDLLGLSDVLPGE